METLDNKALRQEYNKLFPKGEKRFKLTHYLTILPYKDEYLLLNGLIGGSTFIKKKNFDKTVRDLNQKELDETGKVLQKKYILLPERTNEKDLVRFIFKVSQLKGERGCGLTLALTLRCNFACPYCYESEKKIDITPEIIDKALAVEFNKAKKFKLKSFKIYFFGGEPMLCPEMMAYAVKKVRVFCKKRGIKPIFGIISNGSIYNPRIAELFAAEKDLETIQITMDGPKEIHDRRRIFKSGRGSFDIIMKNIPKWIKVAKSVTIRVNVDQENAKQLPKLLKVLSPWKKKGLIFFLGDVTDYSDREERSKKVLDLFSYKSIQRDFHKKAGKAGFKVSKEQILEFRPYYCSAGIARPHVLGPEGGYYSCNDDLGIKSRNVGDVFSGYNKRKARRWLKYNVINLKHCLSCKHIFFCGGPCPLRAMHGDKFKEFCGDGFSNRVKKYLKEIKEISDYYSKPKKDEHAKI